MREIRFYDNSYEWNIRPVERLRKNAQRMIARAVQMKRMTDELADVLAAMHVMPSEDFGVWEMQDCMEIQGDEGSWVLKSMDDMLIALNDALVNAKRINSHSVNCPLNIGESRDGDKDE